MKDEIKKRLCELDMDIADDELYLMDFMIGFSIFIFSWVFVIIFLTS